MNQRTAQMPLTSHRDGFFRWIEIGVEQLDHCDDGLQRLWQGELQGILVHGVYAETELPELVSSLENHQPKFLQTWFPEVFRSWFYGRNLNLTDPQLEPYFDEAIEFHRDLREWSPDFQIRVSRLLSRLAQGAEVTAPPGIKPQQQYMFTTLRGHDPQGYIPAHCDNEFFLRPAYQHLTSLCEPHILSYVLSFAAGDAGAATEIFDFRQSFESARLISDDRYANKPDIDAIESVKIRIPAGSMLIFDSGRYLHRLTPLEGKARRWTACSFMAKSKLSSGIYCWG